MNDDFFSSTQIYRVQKTIKSTLGFEGVGLHTGKKCKIRLVPAPANHGIVFARVDLQQPARVFAHFDAVISTKMATSLGYLDRPEVCIGTVEHLMAALYAIGTTNILIEVEGPEIPILDGSSAPFLDGILETGLDIQPFSCPNLKILKPIKIYQQDTICELLPRNRLRLTVSIDFPHPLVGCQTYALELTPNAFRDEVCYARTFGFLKDQEILQKNNLALGASLDNVLAFSENAILNPEGVRLPEECVRHKLLDALGDLALCGCWIEGEMLSFRGGHSIHLALLKSLKTQRSHWTITPAQPLAQHSSDEIQTPLQLQMEAPPPAEILTHAHQ